MAVDSSTCVAFDLDDTLYKERDFVISGRRAVAEDLSADLGLKSEDLLRMMNDAPDAFDALLSLPEAAKSGITINRILEVYRSHKPDITLSDETAGLLSALKSSGVILAVITDGRSLTQRNKINSLGLGRFIDEPNILISEEIGADKTSRAPFDRQSDTVHADRYIYVGDNPAKDFHWPGLLGWTTVMLRDVDGINVPSQSFAGLPPDYLPRHIIDRLPQLIDII